MKAQPDIAGIVSRSMYLAEVLSAGTLPGPDNASKRMERWSKLAAQGNQDLLRRRFQWDSLNEAHVLEALSGVAANALPEEPQWAAIVRELSSAAQSTDPADFQNVIGAKPVPFQELLFPALVVARRRLQQSPLHDDLIAPEAYTPLESWLLQRLSFVSLRVLDREFSRYRPAGPALLNLVLNAGKTKPADTTCYRAFVSRQLEDGFSTLFMEYPVLARVWAVTIQQWTESIAEFIHRLSADRADLSNVFNVSSAKVTQLTPGLSDPHHGGRTVIAVGFACGGRVVYKPKNVDTEFALGALFNWCHARGLSLDLHAMRILPRGNYGWVEFVENADCRNDSEASRYYKRAGMLLGLLHALRATDCHSENLVAHGEHPVLIDAETLLQPDTWFFRLGANLDQMGGMDDPLESSVMRVGLLPVWKSIEGSNTAVDITGLGGIQPQRVPRSQWQVKSINTDEMVVLYGESTFEPLLNVPRIQGVVVQPERFRDDVVAGFEETYRLLVRHRREFLEEGGPFDRFQRLPVRLLHRNTRAYFQILHRSLSPESMTAGVDRSIALDILSRTFLGADEKPYLWSIVAEETRALEQLDIPHFVGPPAYARALAHIANLGEADLSTQRHLIEESFRLRNLSATAHEQLSEQSEPQRAEQAGVLGRGEFIDEAKEIGERIRQRIAWAKNGTPCWPYWIEPALTASGNRLRMQLLGNDMYSGRSGIALFFSALHHATGTNDYAQLALETLRPIRRVGALTNAYQSFFANQNGIGGGIGGVSGIGSIIYCLARSGGYLSDPSLIEDAIAFSRMVTEERIAAGRRFDIIGGFAGAALSLLTLYGECGDREVLKAATACGNRLLQWTPEINRLTGFSHGAAGIAYAALRLFAITENQAFSEVARRAMEYERQLFSPSAHNWPDLRDSAGGGEAQFMVSWCHGAPGIAMARVASLSILDTPEIREEIEIGLATTLGHSAGGPDHVCCGNAGRVEVMLVAAERMNDPLMRGQAERLMSGIIGRKKQTGDYIVNSALPSRLPSLFQGISGIGYECLRLADPSLRSTLLLA